MEAELPEEVEALPGLFGLLWLLLPLDWLELLFEAGVLPLSSDLFLLSDLSEWSDLFLPAQDFSRRRSQWRESME